MHVCEACACRIRSNRCGWRARMRKRSNLALQHAYVHQPSISMNTHSHAHCKCFPCTRPDLHRSCAGANAPDCSSCIANTNCGWCGDRDSGTCTQGQDAYACSFGEYSRSCSDPIYSFSPLQVDISVATLVRICVACGSTTATLAGVTVDCKCSSNDAHACRLAECLECVTPILTHTLEPGPVVVGGSTSSKQIEFVCGRGQTGARVR
jgi:hypothetical protein